MSEQKPDGYPERLADEFGDDDPDASSWPFWAAAIVVLLLVAVVGTLGVINSHDSRVGDDTTQIQYVVNDAFTARNSLNYDQYRGAYCTATLNSPEFPTAEQFAATNRADRDAHGLLVIPSMKLGDITDTTQVAVTWHREETADQSQVTNLTVVREGDKWKVCSL